MRRYRCGPRILSLDVEGQSAAILRRLQCHFDLVVIEGELREGLDLPQSICTFQFAAEYNRVYSCTKRAP